jgi:DNA-binding transcriptional regulator PaaX
MGKIEQEGKKRRQRKDLQKLILGSVALAGALSVAAVAPNVLSALDDLGIAPGNREQEIIKRSRERLARRGLLKYEGKFLRLTPKGERTLRVLELKDPLASKSLRWDGRWRVLIFDIPEGRKAVRQQIRNLLTKVGFVRLQDSVWLYPYDAEDIITLIKADLRIGRDVLYLIVDFLEQETPYLRYFGLQR